MKIVDFAFTAQMEKELDDIANAKMMKKKMIDDSEHLEFAKEIEEKRISLS